MGTALQSDPHGNFQFLVEIDGITRAAFHEATGFDSTSDRAIFISTPHRGSDMASNWIGKISTHLVHLPKKLAKPGFRYTFVLPSFHRLPSPARCSTSSCSRAR